MKATDDGSVLFQRAAIYEALGKTAEAIAAYKEALSFDRSLSTRLALARLYSQQKDTKAAVAELQEAEKVVYSDISSQVQIAELYRQAGRKDLAAAANKKVQEMLKRQAEMSQGGAAGANIPLPAAAPDKPKAGG